MRSFKRIFTLSTTIMASAGLLLGLAAAPASATIQRHFIQVSTHGSPSWSADATLYDSKNGTTIYTWKQDRRIGGRALWYFNADAQSRLNISLHGVTAYPYGEDVKLRSLLADRDYCFRVNATGYPFYTGDSVTGGCNDK